MAKAYTFDQASVKRIADAVRRLESQPRNRPRTDRPAPATLGKARWFGKTATCEQWPNYPDAPAVTMSPANTYCVQLLERWINEASGPGERDEEEIEESRYVLARLACPSWDARYVVEGTEVEVWRVATRRGMRYYFRPLDEQERLFELTSPMTCGFSGTAKLYLGPGPGPLDSVTFNVYDTVGLVATLPGAPTIAPVGTMGIAKYFHDRGNWEAIALGACEESGCDFSGEITVGTGSLSVDGCWICESNMGLRFDKGRLCEVTEGDVECVELPQPTFEAGKCISISQSEYVAGVCPTYTISNDMTLVAGTCISIDQEDCAFTINNTMAISGGECIDVEQDGCDVTIVNTLKVISGNGIKVQKEGCNYRVSLDSSESDPKTTLRFLCGVELTPIQIACVQDEYGDWSFSVTGGVLTEKFTELTLPSAIVEDITTDCGDYDYPVVDPPPPPSECDECPDCPEGQVKWANILTGNCGCHEPGYVPHVEGYLPCGPPQGEYLTVKSINCDDPNPYFVFELNDWPPGAQSAEIVVVGDKGSGADVGPLHKGNTNKGQEYWGALQEQWGQIQPGECFEITVLFWSEYPPGGELIATKTFTFCCDPEY